MHRRNRAFIERQGQFDPLQRHFAVGALALAADPFTPQPLGHRAGCTGTEEGIEHDIARLRRRQHDAIKQRLGLLGRMGFHPILADAFLPAADWQHPVRAHLQLVIERLHRAIVESIFGLLAHRGPDQSFVGIGEAGALEIGHGIGLAPDHIVENPEAHILHRRTDAEDVVIGADYPQRTVGLQNPPRLGQPFAGELVIGRKTVEFVPGVSDRVDMAAIGPRQITAELEIVGRIGENHVDRGARQTPHRLDAIARQDLAQRQILLQCHCLCGARAHPFLQHYLYHLPAIAP